SRACRLSSWNRSHDNFLQLTQLMTSSYMRSTISTIEKRFGLSSQTSGLLVSFNEVGNTLLIIFVSYFGSRVHRPRFIGYGAILVALSGLITSLPHFLIGPYEYDRTISGEDFLCINLTDMCLPGHKGTSVSEVCTSQVERSSMVLGLLFLGQTLLGIGGVPIQPFGISYIDDFASKSNSPLYIGILFATTTMGPALAFIVGSVMLRFYVDIDKFSAAEIHINNKDPRWVGAWWLGFILTASIVAISSIPYFFFPRELPKEETREKIIQDTLIKFEKGRKLVFIVAVFPMIFFRTIKNPIFAVVIFALFNLSGMIAGLATFMAKFLEQQFTLTASLANMIIGAVQLPSGMMGIILGGAIMKNCHLSLRYATIMCIFGLALCVLFDIPLLFLGCPTHAVAGLDPSGRSGVPKLRPPPQEQLFADCNRQCNCSSSGFNPVCGQNNIEYVTPCFAGCSGLKYNAQAKKILVSRKS
uniref:Solute carrier organic anion transporter family member n=1 Tax=Anolis carolinensis TaxID=28377 RepID=H9GK46_ANOCA